MDKCKRCTTYQSLREHFGTTYANFLLTVSIIKGVNICEAEDHFSYYADTIKTMMETNYDELGNIIEDKYKYFMNTCKFEFELVSLFIILNNYINK